MRARAQAVLLPLVLLAAGCASPPDAGVFAAHASGPASFAGYDYGGRTMQRGNGTASIAVDAGTDAGTASFAFERDGRAWRVEVIRFQGSAPWQEGGVRSGFDVHGSTGLGGAELPRLRARSAGWGIATVTLDGAPFPEPVSGEAAFDVAYVVADPGPRNLSTGVLPRATSRAAYTPMRPDDAAMAQPAQVLLDLRSPGGPFPRDVRGRYPDVANGTDFQRTWPLAVEPGARDFALNVTVVQPPPTPAPARLSFAVFDPSGMQVDSWEFVPLVSQPMGAAEHAFAIPQPLQSGLYRLEVSGVAAGAEYRVDTAIDYADPVFLHVVYGNVAFE
jgi:hypothetical protein